MVVKFFNQDIAQGLLRYQLALGERLRTAYSLLVAEVDPKICQSTYIIHF